ncbi:protein of unknown function [Methanocaldococcus lauensis]|nr:protein of unknown function [Methanocaldococcus lauensis]
MNYKSVREALKNVDLVSATLTSTNQGLIKFRREADETILNIELMVF